jgi:4-coumarate--CoA ligase
MVKSSFETLSIGTEPLHDAVFKFLQSKPDQIALVNGQTGFSVTFKETENNIKNVASALHRLGICHGDIVSIFSPNCLEYVYSVFAIMANGAAASSVNPSYTLYELEHALKLTKAKWWVTIPKLNILLQQAIKNTNVHVQGIIIIGSNEESTLKGTIPFWKLLLDDGSCYPDVSIDSKKDTSMIMYSSGTTGLPKGVMLSHYNVLSMLTILGFWND